MFFSALVILSVFFVSLAFGQECVQRTSGEDGKEIVVMMQGADEGPGMMMGCGGYCGGMMSGGEHPGMFLGMEKELGLSDEQVSKLKDMRMKREKQAIQDRAELDIMELELRDLMSEDEIDLKAVDGKIDKISALKGKIRKDGIHAMVDAKKVLTAEQRKKLREMKGRGMGMGTGMGMMNKRIEMKKIISE
jgi:Spy/CpxP family protein refolding chaperone